MSKHHLAIAALAIGMATLFARIGDAQGAGGPFYFAPPPTHECQGVTNCLARTGPWVAVPAHGEATFLIGCPLLFGDLIGGTDALASSANVRVWFDGALGAPIGVTTREGALLLFHAVTDNGQPGSFQPILGCVALLPKNRVSTLAFLRSSAVPGTAPAAPLDLRSRVVVVRPYFSAGERQPGGRAARCGAGDTLVGSWGAIGFQTPGPPTDAQMASITDQVVVRGDAVKGYVERLRAGASPVPAVFQYGAMCEP